MTHGSSAFAGATIVQPATFRRHPRGIAIVRFAHIPSRFVLPHDGSE